MFSIERGHSFALAPGETHYVIVIYAPKVPGRDNSAALVANAGSGDVTMPLLGKGK